MENAKLNNGENITENTEPVELDNITEKNEEVVSVDEEAQAEISASAAKRRPAAAMTTQEKIEKIRATEQAKLEALKEREREKTRLAIEKERERLERELRNEIRQLEAQLKLSGGAFDDNSFEDEPVIELKSAPKPAKKAVKQTASASAAKKKAAKQAAAQPKKTAAKAKTVKAAEPADEAVTIEEKIKIAAQAQPYKIVTDQSAAEQAEVVTAAEAAAPATPVVQEMVQPAASAPEEPAGKPANGKPEVTDAPINNLQKLKEQIMAQKMLEKELMEKEAKKAQVQDKTISERIASLGMLNVEEGDQLISVEEFGEQRRIIESLKEEKQELQFKVASLHEKLDKLFTLQIDGMNVMEAEGLSPSFIEYCEKRKQQLDAMNKKITELEKICAENARQIDEAEEAFLRLQETHQLQARRIADLSEQIENVGSRRPAFGYSEPAYSPRDYNPGYRSSEFSAIYRELDSLQREISRLASNIEYGPRFGGFKDKERELESLKAELERRMGITPSASQQCCPYYQAPQPQPVVANSPGKAEPANQNSQLNEDLIAEINKIKEEIAAMKEQQTQSYNESIAIMKEVQNEITRTREEQKFLTEQKDKDIEYYKEKLEENEKEKAELISDKEKHLRKIEYLEKEIAEREKTISEMQERLNKLSADDIIDPEFKRKIRVVRDMEKDIIDRLSEEENLYQKNLEELAQKIAEKKKAIDDIRANIERLDRNYQNSSDKSSMARDVYERTKGKSLIEFQLQRESLSDLEDDYKRVENKYQEFEKAKQAELNKVKVKEAEIVEYYLNRLRKEIAESEGFRSFREALQEREDLKIQLEELKANPAEGEEPAFPADLDDAAIGNELKTERKDQLLQQIESLEEEIRAANLTYNQSHQKLTDLKIELEKRVEYEKQLRGKEEDVANFYSHKLSLNKLTKQLQTINDQLDEKKSHMARINEDPMLRTEFLRQKAEISDLEVHKNDIEVKIDYFKKAISELECKPIIGTYMKLVNQINQIRDASREIRENAESVKLTIQQKSQLLEQLKEKLKRYENPY